ncbi:hypothetical protein [Limihaloglobus sulfuriphilus]|uniref:hypothetical protein n=1 Tax=Limihaloglobus sulfuriphilus TaxID=1851148 RepID=UPI0011BA7B07|nr:hypothetical protein [Limihaloglobus sulfuriphilus]
MLTNAVEQLTHVRTRPPYGRGIISASSRCGRIRGRETGKTVDMLTNAVEQLTHVGTRPPYGRGIISASSRCGRIRGRETGKTVDMLTNAVEQLTHVRTRPPYGRDGVRIRGCPRRTLGERCTGRRPNENW